MNDLILNESMIKRIKEESVELIEKLMGQDLMKVILFGSCSRGDYTQDSDVDIALITSCDRVEVKKYNEGLAAISTQMAMKYFSLVNFVCLPYDEFMQKKSWYLYFQNIEEGEVLYG